MYELIPPIMWSSSKQITSQIVLDLEQIYNNVPPEESEVYWSASKKISSVLS
jgi:hypothetical protein